MVIVLSGQSTNHIIFRWNVGDGKLKGVIELESHDHSSYRPVVVVVAVDNDFISTRRSDDERQTHALASPNQNSGMGFKETFGCWAL
jgi:hypothetical protein